MNATIDALRRDLDGIEVIDDPGQVLIKSRDYFWYSPILKPLLRDKVADLVVRPRAEDQVIRALAACVRHGVPVTTRGGGTGNYGQAVPLKRGVVLEMTGLDRPLWLRDGRARVESGMRLDAIDDWARPEGWELRWFPSTKRAATIGGFIAGGSGGIGSIRWGMLRDPGAILGLRVITAEARPRVLDLAGADVAKVIHAYGTTGIITQCEVPLAASLPWVEIVAVFDDFAAMMRFGYAFAARRDIVKNLLSLHAWPLPSYFKTLKDHLPEGRHAALLMVARDSLPASREFIAAHGATITLERAHEDAPTTKDAGPLYEYTWNHTTLQVLKADKRVTYMQTIFGAGDQSALIESLHREFGEEVMLHVEINDRRGDIGSSALQVVRFTTPERLEAIVRRHLDLGMSYSNPHTYFLADKAIKLTSADPRALFKREADPHGLLNPGKIDG